MGSPLTKLDEMIIEIQDRIIKSKDINGNTRFPNNLQEQLQLKPGQMGSPLAFKDGAIISSVVRFVIQNYDSIKAHQRPKKAAN